MDYKELVYAGRSVRRFDATRAITDGELLWLADLGRVTPRGRNAQWIRFGIANQKATCDSIFPTLSWAADLPDWDGPREAERPTAYILLLEDTRHAKGVDIDLGIVSQTILLGARTLGLGGCHILAFRAQALAEALGMPAHLRARLVLAIGKPAEEVELRQLPASGRESYWREGSLHCVPKADLHDVVIKL